MKLENGDVVVSDSKQCDAAKYRTRMKKVAAPPPPTVVNKQPLLLSNGTVNGGARPPLSMTPGEDCAIDESLEGRMVLEVVLPDCKVVRMTVERRTPMMDLLVEATTSNRISPGGHIINVISKDERNVPYKPNTPIGSLDASTVYIIPKSTLELPIKRMPKLANQPFEQTFRLQVNLPLNQRMVLRVSPRITLAELKSQICSEKELDHSSHHLVHPAQPDTILDLNATLEVYGCAEISLMSNSGLRDSIRNTSTNIFPCPKIEEEKKKRGILRLFSRKKRDFSIETTNGLHTSHSEHSTLNRNSYQPKQSIKRKPAPAPPPTLNSSPAVITQSSISINSRPESEISVKTNDEIESSISHSRHSSDSSGYHEPSVFSDCSENKSPEASIVHSDSVSMNDASNRQNSPLHKDYSDGGILLKRSSMTSKDTNLKNAPSCSNVSIISASRKRKAPQPPVSTLPAIESPDAPSTSKDAVRDLDVSATVQDTVGSHQEVYDPEEVEQHGAVLDSDSNSVTKDSVQQESEALQFLEDVLQESENCGRGFSGQRMLDDSDTDSLKDGEVISVCQAEVHASANDQDSSDSIIEPPTVVTPDPALPKSSFAPLSAPNSQPEGCEVVDASADDSGISQSLTSDADSSMPSLNSDLRAMSDSGCQEEIYCNVTDLLDAKSVPSSDEFHAQENVANGRETDMQSHLDVVSENCKTVNFNSINQGMVEEKNNQERDFPEKFSRVSEKLDETNLKAVSSQGPVESSSCIEESKCDNSSDIISITSSLSVDSARSSLAHTPQIQKRLDNFAMGCYAKDNDIDIYSISSPEISNQNDLRIEAEAPTRKSRNPPDVKIIPFHERNLKEDELSSENSRGTVIEKCAQLNNMSTLPLTGRSSSLFNLTPSKKLPKVTTEFKEIEEHTNGGMKRTHSDQNVAKELETVQMKETFFQEQKRLQEEYRRLQEQFISWQKQLLCNQSLLQSEKIVPQMPFPSLEGLTSLDNTSARSAYEQPPVNPSDKSFNYNDFHTRSLPRPKTKPLTLKEPVRPRTPPLAHPPSETSVVNIDISSQEPAKRPESLISCSVETQASSNQDDKVTQIPSPQDKVTQVPSPQEKVTSGTQAPSPENVLNKDTSAQTSEIIDTSPTDASSNSLSSPDIESSKSQTLPRPRPKPNSALQQPSGTMTLNRNSRPRSQVVSVTIGSWQQRQTAISDIEPLSNVASTRSKFMSLENIPQGSIKPISSTMEKRKLPPVPTENKSSERVVQKNETRSIEPDNMATRQVEPKSISRSTEPKSVFSTVPKTEPVYTERGDKKQFRSQSSTEPKIPNTIPKKVEEASQKTKSEIKLASKEPAATFKLTKPFVKLSSMKDEPHPPSIIGLKKWPLSEISESHGTSDGRQAILEDLKSNSKRPGGYVQDKIRRAEVDLRKPKSSKTESSVPVPKSVNTEVSKLHITKVSVNNPKSNADVNVPVQKSSSSSSNVPPVATTSSTANRSSTMPKSQSLNSELLSVFLRKASKDSSNEKSKNEVGIKMKHAAQTVTVNGSVQSGPPPPPPPPPPVPQASSSAMPTIPPAEQIPVSSQLLMARETKTLPVTRKESKKSPSKLSRTADPREELMLEIRGFGGKHALRKNPGQKTGWHLRVYGAASTVNT